MGLDGPNLSFKDFAVTKVSGVTDVMDENDFMRGVQRMLAKYRVGLNADTVTMVFNDFSRFARTFAKIFDFFSRILVKGQHHIIDVFL